MYDDLRITFKRPSGGDWLADIRGQMRALCFSGVSKYVELPPGCVEFKAVFSARRSNDTSYELGERGLDIIDTPDFYSEIQRLLESLWRDGYHYMHVEYEL